MYGLGWFNQTAPIQLFFEMEDENSGLCIKDIHAGFI
jgi:hypothetical protein